MHFVLILLFAINSVYAQLEVQHRLGLSFGAGVSNVMDNKDSSNKNSIIFVGSSSILYSLKMLDKGSESGSYFELETGLCYFGKGDTYEFFTGFGGERTKTFIRVSFLEVPVLFSYISQKETVGVKVSAGMGLAFPISKTRINTDKELNSPDGFRRNIPMGRDHTAFQPNLQFHLLFVGNLGLSFGPRIKYDLKPIWLPSRRFSNYEGRALIVELCLGYQFDFRKKTSREIE